MQKFIAAIATIILTFFVISFSIGIRLGPKVDTELVVKLDYSRDYVYSMYTNIREYPRYKKDLENVEILEMSGNSIIRWRENYKNNGWKEYEIIGKNTPTIFDYKIYASSNNYTPKVETTFLETDNFTEITMKESGAITNSFKRGLKFLFGENSYLKSQSKWLRVTIVDEQINRK